MISFSYVPVQHFPVEAGPSFRAKAQASLLAMAAKRDSVKFSAYDFPEDKTPPEPPTGLKKYALKGGEKVKTLNTKRNGSLLLRIGFYASLATGAAYFFNMLTSPEHSYEMQEALNNLHDYNDLRKQTYNTSATALEDAFQRHCLGFMNSIGQWVAKDRDIYYMNRVAWNSFTLEQQTTLRNLCIEAANTPSAADLKPLYDRALVTLIGPTNSSGADLLTMRQASNKFFDSLSAKTNREHAFYAALMVSLGITAGGIGLLITGRKPEEAPPEIS